VRKARKSLSPYPEEENAAQEGGTEFISVSGGRRHHLQGWKKEVGATGERPLSEMSADFHSEKGGCEISQHRSALKKPGEKADLYPYKKWIHQQKRKRGVN